MNKSPQFNVSQPSMWAGGVAIVAMLVVVGFLLGRNSVGQSNDPSQNEPAAIQENPIQSLAKTGAAISKKCASSVVYLDVRTKGDGNINARRRGTGVIVEADGLILTSLHLIENAASISIQLLDGRSAIASVEQRIPRNDLALLRINLENLVPIEWGDSDQVTVGEVVWAIGNPFGLQNSLSMGIVSGIQRTGVSQNPSEVFLQTDAAMHPGNSGGPLLNAEGQVIGISTAILGEKYQGVGFAVPSKIAAKVAAAAAEPAPGKQGWIGLVVGETHSDGGAVVLATPPKHQTPSPAEKAGVRKGDVIVKIDGTSINTSQEARKALTGARANSTLAFQIKRGVETLTIRINVVESPKPVNE